MRKNGIVGCVHSWGYNYRIRARVTISIKIDKTGSGCIGYSILNRNCDNKNLLNKSSVYESVIFDNSLILSILWDSYRKSVNVE